MHLPCTHLVSGIPCALIFQSWTFRTRLDLSEFFETQRNLGEMKVRVGREWRTDELRLKSNEDLHKLWFVLLKEKNMLLTMEHAYKEEYVAMPNPERIDKVEMSMENLEEVVRERNRAFHKLEVGISGERERTFRPDWTGRLVPYKPMEHSIPLRMNTGYRRKLRFHYMNRGGEDVADFQRRYREKLGAIDKVKQLKQMREVRIQNISVFSSQFNSTGCLSGETFPRCILGSSPRPISLG